MEIFKADLHMHGPIGFQKYWLKKQGYLGKNLLKEIADSCLDKGVNLCAITSDEDEIPRGTIHDRFNWLKENNANRLPAGYEFDTLGENIGIISRYNYMLDADNKLYLVNGQTVRAGPLGSHFHYLVVGSNEVPNHIDLDDTVEYVKDHENMFGGAEHALCEEHGGIGEENLERLLPLMTFIEGHNSQLRWDVSKKTPLVGNYCRELNIEAQNYAEEKEKPWIATSDAHIIEDAGLSYIEFDSNRLDTSTEDKFFDSLEKTIFFSEFNKKCNYPKLSSWAGWTSKMMIRQISKKIFNNSIE